MRKRKKLLFAVLTCLMIFACGAITVFAADGGKEYVPKMYSSFWALVPPIVAIGLALITKKCIVPVCRNCDRRNLLV